MVAGEWAGTQARLPLSPWLAARRRRRPAAMVQPLVKRAIVKKRTKRFQRHQSDTNIGV